MSSVLDSYAPMKGEITRRLTGSLVSFETGEASSYGLFNAQERGVLFIGPGTEVYAGMVVGICSRNEDMTAFFTPSSMASSSSMGFFWVIIM